MPSNLDRFKTDWPTLRSHAMTAGTAVVNTARQVPGILRDSPTARFRTISWCIVISFVGFCILASANPFRLLIPGAIFPIPAADEREIVQLYGLDRGSDQIIPFDKPLALPEDLAQRVHLVAYAIDHPPDIREARSGLERSVQYLPHFGNAVRRVWFDEKTAGGLLIIDLRAESLDSELALFFKDREDDSSVSASELLDGYFRSLTLSLFPLDDRVQAIQYLIDGKVGSRPGMSFDLGRRYARSN